MHGLHRPDEWSADPRDQFPPALLAPPASSPAPGLRGWPWTQSELSLVMSSLKRMWFLFPSAAATALAEALAVPLMLQLECCGESI